MQQLQKLINGVCGGSYRSAIRDSNKDPEKLQDYFTKLIVFEQALENNAGKQMRNASKGFDPPEDFSARKSNCIFRA